MRCGGACTFADSAFDALMGDAEEPELVEEALEGAPPPDYDNDDQTVAANGPMEFAGEEASAEPEVASAEPAEVEESPEPVTSELDEDDLISGVNEELSEANKTLRAELEQLQAEHAVDLLRA